MKKLLPLLVVVTLVLSGLGAVAFSFDAIKTDVVKIENEISTISPDELDQYQTVLEVPGIIGQFPMPPYWNVYIAQSFIPQKKFLTRVQILIARNATTTYPYVLAIREDLTGENIATTSVSAEDIPVIENITDMEWIEFDFDDVLVTTGQTYYMVSYTTNETDNFYGWGASASSLYPNGTVFVSKDGGETWENEPDNDMCFMTYGQDNSPPTAPDIDGPNTGKVGKELCWTFHSDDENGDMVKYLIDWGDETPYETGFNEPCTPVEVCHTYKQEGTYTIKAYAQDEKGDNSGESTFEVTIPRVRAYYVLFLRLFARFPNAFPILRYLLGLQ